jgi:hypothetical protein
MLSGSNSNLKIFSNHAFGPAEIQGPLKAVLFAWYNAEKGANPLGFAPVETQTLTSLLCRDKSLRDLRW